MNLAPNLTLTITIIMLLCACGSQQSSYRPDEKALEKIKFGLDHINEQGLSGPEDGKTAVHYEFCIPNSPEFLRAVQKIDPSLQTQPGSKGRVGCLRGREVLCMGNTHQEKWREILYRLAELPYVESIVQTHFE